MNTIKYPFFFGLYHMFQKNKYIINIIDEPKEKIHIIGNGWASYHFSKQLDKKKYIPVIISPNELGVNTTKLIDYLDNNNLKNNELFLEKNKKCEYIKANVCDIDVENKKIIIDNKIINYKNLVLSIGSETNYYGIKGVKENTLNIKNTNDIDELRKKIIKDNQNSLDMEKNKIIVVGAGPTGIELAYKLSSYGKVDVIERMDKILPGFNNYTRTNIIGEFEKKNINIHTNNKVLEISNLKNIITDKSSFQGNIILWTGGVKFNGFGKTVLSDKLASLSKVNSRGIYVNSDFSIGKNTNIYCIGDMVANAGPPTAQNAKNQAKWLANYFNNDKKSSTEFRVNEFAKIIHLEEQVYIESKYYSGKICKHFDYIIQFFYKI